MMGCDMWCVYIMCGVHRMRHVVCHVVRMGCDTYVAHYLHPGFCQDQQPYCFAMTDADSLHSRNPNDDNGVDKLLDTLFNGLSNFNGDLSRWDTSSVTTMRYLTNCLCEYECDGLQAGAPEGACHDNV